MIELVNNLNKRRTIIMYIIVFLSCLGLVVDYYYTVLPSTYFDGKYNMLFVYGLIVYKLIELPILYYILVHRHLLDTNKAFPKLKKQSKILFFLIIQGNTIFGLLAYKCSANILFFLLFMLIAFITVTLIKPNKLFL